jgi:hypothetical protein
MLAQASGPDLFGDLNIGGVSWAKTRGNAERSADPVAVEE